MAFPKEIKTLCWWPLCFYHGSCVCKPSASQLRQWGGVNISAKLKLLTQGAASPNELCTQQIATLSEYFVLRAGRKKTPLSYYTRWPAGHPVQYPTLARPILAISHVQSLDHIMWSVWFKGVKMRLLNSSLLIQSVILFFYFCFLPFFIFFLHMNSSILPVYILQHT